MAFVFRYAIGGGCVHSYSEWGHASLYFPNRGLGQNALANLPAQCVRMHVFNLTTRTDVALLLSFPRHGQSHALDEAVMNAQ